MPDTAPDGLTEKVILVKDLGVPIEIALGRFEAAHEDDLAQLADRVVGELSAR